VKGFGERFKEVRIDLGLNKKEFAKMVEMAPSSVTRYENGEMDITVNAVKKIAEKLGISACIKSSNEAVFIRFQRGNSESGIIPLTRKNVRSNRRF